MPPPGWWARTESKLPMTPRPGSGCAGPAGATTPNGDDPTLFQATPLVILRGDATVIHSEEVYCI